MIAKYMEHDWMPIWGYSTQGEDSDDVRCKRCNATIRYWEVNIPCGSRTRSATYDGQGKAVVFAHCVEKDYEPVGPSEETVYPECQAW